MPGIIPAMKQRITDIAIIEQRYGEGEWRSLGYIGPGREDIILSTYLLHEGACLRLRYFDTERKILDEL